IEDEWSLLVDSIEKGVIPDVEDPDQLRAPLEVEFSLIITYIPFSSLFSHKHFPPNPLRATELREIGPPVIQGWAVRVWPDLRRHVKRGGFTTQLTVSDTKIAHILGSSVSIESPRYGSTEYGIALTYYKGNCNINFKVSFLDGVIEFLDAREPSDQLVTGGHYEPVLTSRNGFWRYRLGDVVSVKGFDPGDGMPIVNYLHRQDGLVLSFGTTCTESQLTNAIVPTANRWIGQITDFTIVSDEREVPITYGYLVEISGEIG
ncbi:GH3 auxin-responsive promoter, partial [Suillus ampliporus]